MNSITQMHVTRQQINNVIAGMVQDFGPNYVDQSHKLFDTTTGKATCFVGVVCERLGIDHREFRVDRYDNTAASIFFGQPIYSAMGLTFTPADAVMLSRCMSLNDQGAPWGEIAQVLALV